MVLGLRDFNGLMQEGNKYMAGYRSLTIIYSPVITMLRIYPVTNRPNGFTIRRTAK